MASGGRPLADTPELDGEQRTGLRNLSLRGGVYLVLRESSGIVIRLAGVLVVTRLIGPYDFGLYASAAAFTAVLASLAQMGVEVSLMSRSDPPSDRAYDTAFTFLIVMSLTAVAVGYGGSVIVSSVAHAPAYLAPFRVLLISIPLNVCWAPAQARIERRFRYRTMALLELSGDVVLYAVSISLAAAGAGLWAPTVGFVAWQGFLFVGSLWAAGSVPRLAWDRSEVRRILRFGTGYGFTNSLVFLAGLVNPLVVGHYVGPTGVGYVAVAQRLVGTLAFVNRAAWRLAVVALSRVQDDLTRLRRGIEEAMALQVVVFGPLLVAFAVVSSSAVPALFGHKWDSITAIFPYLAIGDLMATVFLIPQAVLYAREKNMAVVVKQVLYLLVLTAAALALVPHLGLRGFGLATLVALLPLLFVHVAARRIVPYRYIRVAPWLAAFVPPLGFQLVPWPGRLVLLAPLALVAVLPRMRRDLAEYGRTAWSSVRPRVDRSVPLPDAERFPASAPASATAAASVIAAADVGPPGAGTPGGPVLNP